MGHDDDGAIGKRVQRLGQQESCRRLIQMLCRFVEDHQTVLGQQQARDGEALAFPTRQRMAVFPDERGQAVRRTTNEVGERNSFQRDPEFFIGGVRPCDAQVGGDGAVEDMGVLCRPTDSPAKLVTVDAVEALLGAILLDAGVDAALAAARGWYATRLERLEPGVSLKDAKTELQEFLQARRQPLPRYELLEPAPATGGTFRVRCHVHGLEPAAPGEGRTRRIAEQQAAAAALQRLQGSGGRH